jgi:hypothetical protein
MAHLDDLFNDPNQYDHPKLRSWRSHKQHVDTDASFIEFRRDRDGLTYKPARLYFEAHKKDGTIFADMEPWDDDLNKALVQNGFRAKDPENEAKRFGFMLEYLLEPLQNRYGDGFFNASFITYLKTNGYHNWPTVAKKLEYISENKVSIEEPYQNLTERLDGVFAECAALLKKLYCDPDKAKDILIAAIAYYLDDRYSIFNRRQLGLT